MTKWKLGIVLLLVLCVSLVFVGAAFASGPAKGVQGQVRIVPSAPPSPSPSPGPDPKVWICHSTESEQNPYELLLIAWPAWENAHDLGQGAHSNDKFLGYEDDGPFDEEDCLDGDDTVTEGDDDDDDGGTTTRVYVLQYCVDGQRVFLQSQTAGDLTPIKDEDPCPVLPALGPVEAVAPAAGGILPSPVFFGSIGLGLLGALRLAMELIKRR